MRKLSLLFVVSLFSVSLFAQPVINAKVQKGTYKFYSDNTLEKDVHISNNDGGWREEFLDILKEERSRIATFAAFEGDGYKHELYTPFSGEEIFIPFPHFTWEAHPVAFKDVSSPVYYRIQIAKDVDFKQIIDEDTVGLNRYVPDRPLPEGQLFWRVKALHENVHDLTFAAVSSFSLLPCEEIIVVGGDDADFSLLKQVQEAIDQAVALNKRGKAVQIEFVPGSYHVPDTMAEFMTVKGARNLIINGNGSDINLTGYRTTVCRIDESDHVLIQGFRIDFPDRLPFTQGYIASVDRENGRIGVVTERGFPGYDDPVFTGSLHFMSLLDPIIDGRLKSGAATAFFFEEGILRDGRTFMQTLQNKSLVKNFEEGDRFVQFARKGSKSMFYSTDSQHLTFYDMHSYAAGSGHYLAFNSSVVNLLHCKLLIREGRWMGGNADGAHLRSLRTGPWIEGCVFSGTGDDAIALYARPMSVSEKTMEGRHSRLILYLEHFNLETGDEISLFNPRQGIIVDEAKVTGVKKTNGRYIVDLDREIQAGIQTGQNIHDDDQVWNRSKSCGDFMIRNNRFSNIRRFGTVFRANRGVIENNIYEATSSSAIISINETHYPNGLYCSDIIIRNNIIDDCSFSISPRGAVAMFFTRRGTGFSPGSGAEGRGHRRLFFENNHLYNLHHSAFQLQGVENVHLKGNTVSGMPLDPEKKNHLSLENFKDVLCIP